MQRRTLVIDGTKFSTFEEFSEYFSSVVFVGHQWHGNLDAFNDMLSGGFGSPEMGYKLRWENSNISRSNLGYPETIKWLEKKIVRCHSTNIPHLKIKIAEAREGHGETLFDIIVEIIRGNGPHGPNQEYGVELELI